MKLLVILLVSCFTQQLVAELPPGDSQRGERVFRQCRTCHYPEQAVGHNNGPSLWNIFGQQVGSQPGFDYSEALKNADFVWTEQLMDVWLRDPARFMPGNMMMSNGISDSQQRADLIAYLRQFSE
jgi:cytochrome c